MISTPYTIAVATGLSSDATVTLSLPWLTSSNEPIRVFAKRHDTGAVSEVQSSSYTLTDNNPGFTLEVNQPYQGVSDATVYCYRATATGQEFDADSATYFDPRDIEAALDDTARVVEELASLAEINSNGETRLLRAHDPITVIPSAEARAEKFVYFDAAGDLDLRPSTLDDALHAFLVDLEANIGDMAYEDALDLPPLAGTGWSVNESGSFNVNSIVGDEAAFGTAAFYGDVFVGEGDGGVQGNVGLLGADIGGNAWDLYGATGDFETSGDVRVDGHISLQTAGQDFLLAHRDDAYNQNLAYDHFELVAGGLSALTAHAENGVAKVNVEDLGVFGDFFLDGDIGAITWTASGATGDITTVGTITCDDLVITGGGSLGFDPSAIGEDLIPDASGRSIGSVAAPWGDVNADEIFATSAYISNELLPSADGDKWLGNSNFRWGALHAKNAFFRSVEIDTTIDVGGAAIMGDTNFTMGSLTNIGDMEIDITYLGDPTAITLNFQSGGAVFNLIGSGGSAVGDGAPFFPGASAIMVDADEYVRARINGQERYLKTYIPV